MYENGNKRGFNFELPSFNRKKITKNNNKDDNYIRIPKGIVSKFLIVGLFFFMFIFCASKFGTVVVKAHDDEIFNSNLTYIQKEVTKHYKKRKYSLKSGNSATKTFNELISDGIIEKDELDNIDECDLNKSYVKLTKNKDNSYHIIVSIDCNGILEEKEEDLQKL